MHRKEERKSKPPHLAKMTRFLDCNKLKLTETLISYFTTLITGLQNTKQMGWRLEVEKMKIKSYNC